MSSRVLKGIFLFLFLLVGGVAWAGDFPMRPIDLLLLGQCPAFSE